MAGEPPDWPSPPSGMHSPWQALSVLMGLSGERLARAEHGGEVESFRDKLADRLEEACKIVQEEAKRVIGTYEYGWPRLKPETVVRKGGADTPLLETGALRDSIEYTVDRDNLTAWVGSDDPIAPYQELGTVTIPARSFLAGAAMRKEAEIVRKTGVSVHGLILKDLGING
jgi:phage gpG-like protein